MLLAYDEEKRERTITHRRICATKLRQNCGQMRVAHIGAALPERALFINMYDSIVMNCVEGGTS